LKRPNKTKESGLPGSERRKKVKKNEGVEEKKDNDMNVEDQVEKEKEQLRIVEFLGKIEKPIDSKNKAMRKVNKVLFYKRKNLNLLQKSFKFVLGLLKNLISEEPKPK